MSAEPRLVSLLIVDDDDDIRDSLAELLSLKGYSVATAANGAEALALLEDVRPQLILLDLSMPIMSGYQFRAEQRARPAIAHIPIVVMSAADNAVEKARDMDSLATLTKPIPFERLAAVIARVCDAPS